MIAMPGAPALRLIGFLSVFLLGCSCCASEPPRLRDAAVDAEGIVWAVGKDRDAGLVVLDKDGAARDAGWRPQAQAKPLVVAARRRGDVVVLWQTSPKAFLWSAHRGKQRERLGAFEGELRAGEDLAIFEDTKGNLWLTEEGPQMFRFDGECKGGLVFTAPEDTMMPRKKPYLGPTGVTEEVGGRIWIWPRCWWPPYALAVFENGIFRIVDPLPARRGQAPYAAVAARSGGGLLISATNQGVFALNADSDNAEKLPSEVYSSWISTSATIFEQDGEEFFATGSEPSTLYRLHEGRIVKVFNELEPWPAHSTHRARCVLHLPEGTLLSARNRLLLFPSMEKPPEHFSYESGYGLNEARRLFSCGGDRLFALDRDGLWWMGSIAGLRRNASTPRRSEIVDGIWHWIVAPDSRIWALLKRDAPELSVWRGVGWDHFPIPDGVRAFYTGDLASDSAGRIWLLPDGNELPVAIFDPGTKSWQKFASVRDAFLEFRSGRELFVGDLPRDYRPIYSPDGKRVTYMGQSSPRIKYYDGKKWQGFERKEIGSAGNEDLRHPYFDAEGNLMISSEAKTFAFDGKHWRAVKFVPRPQEFADKTPSTISFPQGVRPASSAEDNEGSVWFMEGGHLKRMRFGRIAEVFAEEEFSPIPASKRIDRVWVDDHGTAFVHASPVLALIHPRRSSQMPEPEVARPEPDGIGICSTQTPFVWRMDGGAWAWSDQPELLIEGIAPGRHHLELASASPDLSISKETRSVNFQVGIGEKEQVASWLARLADPDYAEREKAARFLVKRGKPVLDVLRSAQKAAPDDVRWWMDAVEQEISRNAAR